MSEEERITEEAFKMAWAVRFDTDTLRRYCVATAQAFSGRVLTPGEERDLEITRRAVVIADEITDEQLAALAIRRPA